MPITSVSLRPCASAATPGQPASDATPPAAISRMRSRRVTDITWSFVMVSSFNAHAARSSPRGRGCRFLNRLRRFALDYGAVHDAQLFRRIVIRGGVEHAAVVPHEEIARAPLVTILEALLDGEPDEVVEQRAAFVVGQSLDLPRMAPAIDGLAAGRGMRARERMAHRRRFLLLVFRGERDTARPARVLDGVDRIHAVDA